MELCVTIAARGGSKGVPGKNIRPLLGKPLIAHTIEQAKRCPLVGRVFVSTDSEAIAAVAREYGAEVPYLRPAELASDTAGKLDVLKHIAHYLIAEMKYVPDIIVDLDPTSPLRLTEDIVGAVELSRTSGCDVVITGSRARKNPYFNMVEISGDGSAMLSKKLPAGVRRRQDAPAVYDMNASIYVYRTQSLLNMSTLWDLHVKLYEMPEERSVDIDREIDFRFVEMLMSQRSVTGKHE